MVTRTAYLNIWIDKTTPRPTVVRATINSEPGIGLTISNLSVIATAEVTHVSADTYAEAVERLLSSIETEPTLAWIVPLMDPPIAVH